MVRRISNRCLARRADGHQCFSTGVRTMLGIPLCDRHAVEMVRLCKVVDPVKTVQVFMVSPHVVYYLGDPDSQRVKIGTSHDFRKRYVAVRSRYPEAKLLAVEPGHYDLESARHDQFKHLRTGARGTEREWFRKEPDLMDHVLAVRRQWGDPWSYQPAAR